MDVYLDNFAGPLEESDIELVFQNQVNVATAHRLALVILEHLAEGSESMRTGDIKCHHPEHHR